MIQGFTWASGMLQQTIAATAASAFSHGDVLMLDSTSSVSRINVLNASGTDVLAVAECDSTDSISGGGLARIVTTESWWLASLSTVLTSHVTPGVKADILFSTANGRHYVDPSSANSVRVNVLRGTAGPGALDQSVHSQVIVQFIGNGGNLEFS